MITKQHSVAFSSKSLQSLIHCGCLVFLPPSLSLSRSLQPQTSAWKAKSWESAIRSVNLWRLLHVNNLSEANLNMRNHLFLCPCGKNPTRVPPSALTQSRTKYSAVLNETFGLHLSHVWNIHRRGISCHFQMQDNTHAHTRSHTVGTCLLGWCEAAFCSRSHAPV